MGALARGIARFFGYDVMKYRKSFRFDATLDRLLKQRQFDVVLDVGANIGLFSDYCLRAIPGVEAHSFEPSSSLCVGLQRKLGRYPNWHLAQTALGDGFGTATLNVSDTKSVFNSLNAANHDFVNDFSGLKFDRQEEVPITTLDVYMADRDGQNILLKVDTQGHDFNVLKGAKDTLTHCSAVIVELPFQNIYDSAGTYRDIIDLMESVGFRIFGISPISIDKKGELVEADAFFIK